MPQAGADLSLFAVAGPPACGSTGSAAPLRGSGHRRPPLGGTGLAPALRTASRACWSCARSAWRGRDPADRSARSEPGMAEPWLPSPDRPARPHRDSGAHPPPPERPTRLPIASGMSLGLSDIFPVRLECSMLWCAGGLFSVGYLTRKIRGSCRSRSSITSCCWIGRGGNSARTSAGRFRSTWPRSWSGWGSINRTGWKRCADSVGCSSRRPGDRARSSMPRRLLAALVSGQGGGPNGLSVGQRLDAEP